MSSNRIVIAALTTLLLAPVSLAHANPFSRTPTGGIDSRLGNVKVKAIRDHGFAKGMEVRVPLKPLGEDHVIEFVNKSGQVFKSEPAPALQANQTRRIAVTYDAHGLKKGDPFTIRLKDSKLQTERVKKVPNDSFMNRHPKLVSLGVSLSTGATAAVGTVIVGSHIGPEAALLLPFIPTALTAIASGRAVERNLHNRGVKIVW